MEVLVIQNPRINALAWLCLHSLPQFLTVRLVRILRFDKFDHKDGVLRKNRSVFEEVETTYDFPSHAPNTDPLDLHGDEVSWKVQAPGLICELIQHFQQESTRLSSSELRGVMTDDRVCRRRAHGKRRQCGSEILLIQ